MSDHYLVFGKMMEKVHKHKTQTITSRQIKKNFEQLNRDLNDAPGMWEIYSVIVVIDMITGGDCLGVLWMAMHPLKKTSQEEKHTQYDSRMEAIH